MRREWGKANFQISGEYKSRASRSAASNLNSAGCFTDEIIIAIADARAAITLVVA